MRQRFALLFISQNVQPADDRHHDVEKNDIGHFPQDHFHHGPRIGAGYEVLKSGQFEMLLKDLKVQRFIIHNHDLRRLD